MLNDERAASHQQRSLQIFKEISFIRGMGYALYRLLIMSQGDTETITTLSDELKLLAETLSYSKRELVEVELLCALENRDSEIIWNQVQSLKKTRANVNLENIHVEDGPIFPWFYAAQYLQQQEDIERLRQVIS